MYRPVNALFLLYTVLYTLVCPNLNIYPDMSDTVTYLPKRRSLVPSIPLLMYLLSSARILPCWSNARLLGHSCVSFVWWINITLTSWTSCISRPDHRNGCVLQSVNLIFHRLASPCSCFATKGCCEVYLQYSWHVFPYSEICFDCRCGYAITWAGVLSLYFVFLIYLNLHNIVL